MLRQRFCCPLIRPLVRQLANETLHQTGDLEKLASFAFV